MNNWELLQFSKTIKASCHYKLGQLAISKSNIYYVAYNIIQWSKEIQNFEDVYSWWPFMQPVANHIFAGIEYKDGKYYLAELEIKTGVVNVIRQVHNYDIVCNLTHLYIKDPIQANLLKIDVNDLQGCVYRFGKTFAGWAISFCGKIIYEEYSKDSHVFEIQGEKLLETPCQWIYSQSAGAFRALLNGKFRWISLLTMQPILEEPAEGYILTPFGLSRFRRANQILGLQYRVMLHKTGNSLYQLRAKYYNLLTTLNSNEAIRKFLTILQTFDHGLDLPKFAATPLHALLTPHNYHSFGSNACNYMDAYDYRFIAERLSFRCQNIQ